MFPQQCEHSSIVEVKITTSPVNPIFGSSVLTSVLRYLLYLAAVFVSQQTFADNLELVASERQSTSGYFNLNWNQQNPQNVFILQQSIDPNFNPLRSDVTQWQVPNSNAFAISGLNTGTYHFRIAEQKKPQQWSNTVTVEVTHHSLSKTLFIFSLGAVLFSLLVWIILLNHKNLSRGL